MRALLTKYKLVIRFILTFVLVYGVLSISYKFYLDFSEDSKYYPDYMTHLLGKQTESVLTGFGYRTSVVPMIEEPSLLVIVNQKSLARIIEGCNGMSVVMLFIAFVVAFSDGFKKTFLFVLAGSVLIYAVNLIRVVLLTVGLYHYPWHSELMHEVIFPLAIYGMVFLLWMYWVNHFSKKVKSSNV